MDSDKGNGGQEEPRSGAPQEVKIKLIQKQQDSKEQELIIRERTFRSREKRFNQLAKRLEAKEIELDARAEKQLL